MNEQVIRELVDRGLSTYKIAEELGISHGSARHWLKKYGLKTKHRYVRDGAGPTYKCRCGERQLEAFYKRHPYRCKQCLNKDKVEAGRLNKQRMVEHKGGECVICGYNRCQASLDFHHKDPTTKDPDWRTMRNRVFASVLAELEKCILVCRNCHGEIHAGLHDDHPALAA